MLQDRHLLAAAGACALLGSVLRLLVAIPGLPIAPSSAEPAYFVIDVLLSFGLIGMFAGWPAFRSWAGSAGFAVALVGILVIRTGPRVFGQSGYGLGVGMIGFGLALAALGLIRGDGPMRPAALAWLVSFAFGAVAMASGLATLFMAATVFFCLGFAIGGASLLPPMRRRERIPNHKDR